MSDDIFSSIVHKKHNRPTPKFLTKAPPKKELEDVCFLCFNGGDLIFCNQEDCHKAYHPLCIPQENSIRKNWKCAWHFCTICEATAKFTCYTCTYSLCQGCFIEGELSCIRGNTGFCKGCTDIWTGIENREQKTEDTDQVDFIDRNSRSHLFKMYWTDLNRKFLFKPDELARARNAFKGSSVIVGKEELADQLDDANDDHVSNLGSSSVHLEISSSKRKDIRRCSNSSIQVGSYNEARVGDNDGTSVCNTVWASKELLDFVAHTSNGDTSVLSHFDVRGLLLEYITRNNLRDPHQKSRILCDSRLKNLFEEASIGHFEMLQHLRSHFVKMDTDGHIQARLLDTKPSQLQIRGFSKSSGRVHKRNDTLPETNQDDYATNMDHSDTSVKASADKKFAICKKGKQRSIQTNPDDTAIDYELTSGGNIKPLKKAGAHKRLKTHVRGEHRSLQTNYDHYAAIDVHNINLLYLRRHLLEDLLEDIDKFHDKVVGSFVRIRDPSQKQEMHRLVQVVGTGRAPQPYKTGDKATDVTLEIFNSSQTESIPIVCVSNDGFSEDECKCLQKSIKCGLLYQMRVGEVQEKAMALQEVIVNDQLEKEILRLSNCRDWANEKGQKKKVIECIKQMQLLGTPEERLRRVQEIPEIHMDPDTLPSHKDGELDDKRQGSCMRKRDIGFNSKEKKPIASEPSTSMTGKCIWDKRGVANGSGERTYKMWHYQDPSGKIQGPFSMLQLCKWSTIASFPANMRIWKATEMQENSILLTDALNSSF